MLSWYLPGDRGTCTEDPSSRTRARCRRCISWVYLLLRGSPSWGVTASGEGQSHKLNPRLSTVVSWLVETYGDVKLCFMFFFCFLFFLQCPVLIVWGDKDPWEPIELGRGFINFDSVEDFVTLPNVGHCPQVSLSLFLSQSAHTHSQAYAPAHCACVASALSVVLVLHFLDILDFNVQKVALNCANLDCKEI